MRKYRDQGNRGTREQGSEGAGERRTQVTGNREHGNRDGGFLGQGLVGAKRYMSLVP